MITLVISAITLSLVASASDVLRARSYIFEAIPNGVGSKLIGIIDFEQTGSLTKLNGSISGLKPGQHGFHVHEKGDIGNGCLAAGSHFNPHKMNHGGPSDANRHVGDLGNINTPASGDTPISVADSLLSLTGIHSVIGRAVVVHEKIDDLGKGGASDSLTTGAAGIIEEMEVTTTVGPLNDETSTNSVILASTFTSLSLGFLLVLQRI